MVLLGGVVAYCQEATDAVGCLLEDCRAFDKSLKAKLRQQKRIQRQHAIHKKLEKTVSTHIFLDQLSLLLLPMVLP